MNNLLNAESPEIKSFLEYLNKEHTKYFATLKENCGNNCVHNFKIEETKSKVLLHIAFGIDKIEPTVMQSWTFMGIKTLTIDPYKLYLAVDKETGNIYRKDSNSSVSKFDLVGNVKTFEYCEI